MAEVTGISVADAQALLHQATYYHGAIDGDPGPETMRAVEIIERNAGATEARKDWPNWRRLVASAQAVLTALGHSPGPVDGLFGPNTREALTEWRSRENGTSAQVVRPPSANARSHPAQLDWPRQSGVSAVFGAPGSKACTAGICSLPFAFRLAWDLDTRIWTFRCHEKVAAPMTRIFGNAAEHYGEDRFRELRLDRWGGCYNFRPMRGGNATSMHAWGIAVDLDPERNQLRWGADRAAFAGAEYEPFWQIVMAEGGVPAGYAWGKDWMHFQFARL
jgi:peptidoglycan hydrolase-like protein with peptidoglycan-binding domain